MFFLYIIFFVSGTLAQLQIKYSAVILSPGPQMAINTNSSFKEVWPSKLVELSDIGKKQHHALGLWLGLRYLKASSNGCNPQNIFARAISEDASVMSAQATLAGMCLPYMGSNLSDAYLSQQPIFIKTVSVNDEILATNKACPKYIRLNQEYFNSKLYKDGLNHYKSLMNYLSEHTNGTVESYDDIHEIYNVLSIKKLNNVTLPSWARAVFPQKLKEPACHSYALSSATPAMARLTVGPFIKEIVHSMIYAMSNVSNDVVLSIYSSDDKTMGNILNALALFNGECPPLPAAIIMELLYDNITIDYYVRMWYWNTTDIIEPYIISIPQCGPILCEFPTFKKMYANLLPVDWKAECLELENLDSYTLILTSIFVVFGIFLILIFFDIAYQCYILCFGLTYIEYDEEIEMFPVSVN